VAFRVLAQVRVAIWRRLEALAPAGLALFRSGDLLARLVSDVDTTQDLFIRGLTPALTAVLVGGGAVTVCLLILAPAAGVLAAGLLTGGIAVPLAGAAVARKAARAGAPARGRLAATVTDLLDGADDLHAFGAQDAALAQADAADAELTRHARRTAGAFGLGAGLMSMVSGLTLWAVLLLGVAATGTGTLSRGGARGGRGPREAAGLDQVPPPGLGYPCRQPRGRRLRRRTAASRAGPRLPRRPRAAHPRRAHRPPGPGQPPGAHRGPAARHRRPFRLVHHPRTRRAGPGRPDRGARPRQDRRARQPRRAPPRRRTLPADVGGRR